MQAPVAVPPASATPVERADLARHRRRDPRPRDRPRDARAPARAARPRRRAGAGARRPPERPQQRRRPRRPLLHAGLAQGPPLPRGQGRARAYCAERGIAVQRVGKLVVALTEDELPRFEALEARARENGVEGLETVGPERIRELEPHARRDPRAVVAGDRHRRLPGGRQRLRRRHPGRGRRRSRRGGRDRPRGAPGRRPRRDVTRRRPGRPGDRLRRALVGPRGGADRRRRLGADRPVPRRLLPAHPGAGPSSAGSSTRSRTRASRSSGPLHAPRSTARSGPARTRSSPSPATATGATTSISARSSRSPATPGSGASPGGSGGRASRSSGATSRSGRSRTSSRRYVPELRNDQLRFGPSGVRAQAIDPDGTLVDDFRLGGSRRIVHVRNAPSPGATASLAIAGVLADESESRLN